MVCYLKKRIGKKKTLKSALTLSGQKMKRHTVDFEQSAS